MKYKCLRSLLILSLVFSVLLSGNSPALASTEPSLGIAAQFAVLGASVVVNTGSTTLVGDLGIWPNDASSISGFPPGTYTGVLHAADAVALQAQSDVTTAYNILASQAYDLDITGQDLGGQTLTPGVYHFSTAAQLTGTLTLNALGNPNAVFIFQIGSTLVTTSNSRVLVINGGSNCKVYWQVGSSATLGTSTAFAGNILALQSITLMTGATLAGRALARNAAVTLDTNNIAICPACPIIVVAPPTLPDGTVGTAYSQAITASGGTAPYTYTIISGTQPTGLALNAGTGVLAGTPTAAGSFTFTVSATDSAGCFGSQIYTIVINAAGCPLITLSPSSLPAAIPGTPYSQIITASGGTAPYTFIVTSGLPPPGLSLSTGGTLAGTPTAPGSYTFTVRATDSGGCFGSRIYNLLANCPFTTISPATLPNGTVGTAYSQAITASGGTAPYTYTIISGTQPTGLALNAGTGVLSGTPTAAGSFTFTVSATDSVGCSGSRVYTIVINAAACPLITLAPTILPPLITGTPYSQIITASGGTAPYTFIVTSGLLPPGLSLSTGGTLASTPTAPGSYTFTVTATDTNSCAGSQIYTLLGTCPLITISPATLPNGTVGTAYSQAITASGGTAPYTYTIISGTQPTGLALNAGTGVLAGTPTATGSFTFTVRATDFYGCSVSQIYTIVINAAACPLITLAPTILPPLITGTPYSQIITASGGTAPYTFIVTSGLLPPGLSLSTGGTLAGTPTAPGSYTFTVTATDTNSCAGSQIYTLLGTCPLITISPATFPNGTMGTAYSRTIMASGGTAPYTFAIIAGSPPTGLALNATTGVLAGTPTATGSFTFTVSATDSVGCSGSQIYTIVINAAGCPLITLAPTILPAAIPGIPYSQIITASDGTAPYTFIVTSGLLPPGLILSSSGMLAGTPTTPGSYTFTVTATDANSCAGSQIYTLLGTCPVITVLPTTLPNGTVGKAYSQTITASGGTAPYTFAIIAGSPPTGLTLNATTGVLSGVPTAAGNFTFTVRATDFYGCSGGRIYTLVMATPAPGAPPAARNQLQDDNSSVSPQIVTGNWGWCTRPDRLCVKYLSVQPQEAQVNQPVTLFANVVNRCDLPDTYKVTLKVNGIEEETRTVSVGALKAVPVEFTITGNEPGLYNLDLNGEKAFFVVSGEQNKAADSSNTPSLVGFILLFSGVILLSAVVLIRHFRILNN